jgi:hypothetical protein
MIGEAAFHFFYQALSGTSRLGSHYAHVSIDLVDHHLLAIKRGLGAGRRHRHRVVDEASVGVMAARGTATLGNFASRVDVHVVFRLLSRRTVQVQPRMLQELARSRSRLWSDGETLAQERIRPLEILFLQAPLQRFNETCTDVFSGHRIVRKLAYVIPMLVSLRLMENPCPASD